LRASLRQELRRVLRQLGTAALLVTHDQDEAFAFADRIGVMQGGQLEQWGDSYDIYHRPATPFVARFVGDGRFLRARVVGDDQIDSTLGRLRTHARLDWPSGSDVQVLIRPDDVMPDGADGIPVDVVSAEFRGAETLYTLRLAGGEEIAALFPSHQQHAPGARLRVRLDLEHVVVFAAN
jgi:iron(III) transport system ATP-binding protein